MPDRSPKKLAQDMNARAKAIVDRTTVKKYPLNVSVQEAAAILGHRSGRKGGNSRAGTLSEEERRAIGKRAARARWEQAKK